MLGSSRMQPRGLPIKQFTKKDRENSTEVDLAYSHHN